MKPIDTPMLSYFGEPSVGAWKSDIYNAFAFHDKYAIRLDIERVDKTDGITWDELQKIKNECGFGAFDAVELYPANDDVIDTGNWRHLYILLCGIELVRRKESKGNI